MAVRLKKDDLVVIISGKKEERGKTGRILKVLEDGRVLVEGMRLMKRHQSLRKYKEAGIVEREAPIHASNVALVDPETEKPTRIRIGTDGDGNKVRIAVRSGATLD